MTPITGHLATAVWGVNCRSDPNDGYSIFDANGMFLCRLTNQGWYDLLETQARYITSGRDEDFLNANWIEISGEVFFLLTNQQPILVIKKMARSFHKTRLWNAFLRYGSHAVRDGRYWSLHLAKNQILPTSIYPVDDTALAGLYYQAKGKAWIDDYSDKVQIR